MEVDSLIDAQNYMEKRKEEEKSAMKEKTQIPGLNTFCKREEREQNCLSTDRYGS